MIVVRKSLAANDRDESMVRVAANIRFQNLWAFITKVRRAEKPEERRSHLFDEIGSAGISVISSRSQQSDVTLANGRDCVGRLPLNRGSWRGRIHRSHATSSLNWNLSSPMFANNGANVSLGFFRRLLPLPLQAGRLRARSQSVLQSQVAQAGPSSGLWRAFLSTARRGQPDNWPARTLRESSIELFLVNESRCRQETREKALYHSKFSDRRRSHLLVFLP